MSARTPRARTPPGAQQGASSPGGAAGSGHGPGPETGSATVELAIGFAAFALVLALVLAIASLGLARQGLCRAAGEAARAAVSGEADPRASGERALGELAARGAQVSTSRDGRWETARASLPARELLGVPLPVLECEASARLGSLVP